MDSEMQMEMAKMFFAVMFGGERFEPYIGQLGLSTFVDALTQEAQAQQMKEMGGGAAGAAAEQGLGALDIDVRCSVSQLVNRSVRVFVHCGPNEATWGRRDAYTY